jgi:thiopeptide-type bacteriocin biosynthesis protein
VQGNRVVLRIPMLAWEEIFAGTAASVHDENTLASDTLLEAALAAERQQIRERLLALLADPFIAEAIHIASPDLSDAILLWRQDPESPKAVRVQRSLLRYLWRMAGRATPFGFFAGVGIARRAEATQVRMGDRRSHRRTTRFDATYLSALSSALTADKSVLETALVRINTSLARFGDRFHYIEAGWAGDQRRFALSALDSNAEVAALVEFLGEEWKSAAAVSEWLSSFAECPQEEALEFVTELVAAQVLVTNLEPAITGTDALEDLLLTLERNHVAGDLVQGLRLGQEKLREMDMRAPGAPISAYREVVEHLRQLPIPVLPHRLFQVDLTCATPGATISQEVLEEVERAVGVLQVLAMPFDPLVSFRKAFKQRYEQKWMPLVEVVDSEYGIGVPGIAADGAPGEPDPTLASHETHRLRVLAELLERTARSGQMVMRLTHDDLDRLALKHGLPIPRAVGFHGALCASSGEAADRGDYEILAIGAGGPSGANMLGRFCHCDEELDAMVREHVAADASLVAPAAIMEVVHVPEGRLGNVTARPQLSTYEFEFLGRSGACGAKRIPLSDLLVNVIEDRVVLRSRSLDCEIIPRCTNAHNFGHARNLPLYQLLGWLARQRTAFGLGWSWGALDSLPRLPRVVYGRTILTRAQWTISSSDLGKAGKASASSRYRQVRELRKRLEIPRFVVIGDGDNGFPVDLDSGAGCDALTEVLGKRGFAKVLEVCPDPDRYVARSSHGSHPIEFVVPVLAPEIPAPRPTSKTDVDVRNELRLAGLDSNRHFSPVSDWLYAKLYTGRGMADRLLGQLLAPMMEELERDTLVENWFFVRYADPGFHIRIRMQGTRTHIRREVLPRVEDLIERARAAKLLHDVQYASYSREVERYGGTAGMRLAEKLFHTDSRFALEAIRATMGDGAARERELLSLRWLDRMVLHLGFEVREADELLRRLTAVAAPLIRAWGDDYRGRRAAVEAALRPDLTGLDGTALPELKVRELDAELRERTLRLREMHLRRELTRPLIDITTSLLHMSVNRILRSYSRADEQRLYDMLRRGRMSAAARSSIATPVGV